MAAWVFPTVIDTTFRGCMTLSNGTQSFRTIMLTTRNTTGQFAYFDNNNSTKSSGVILKENTWQFIAITVSSDTLTFYVDGKIVNQQSLASAVPINKDRLVLGITHTGAENFDGNMARNWLFGSVLTPDQISELYLTGAKPSTPLTEYLYSDGTGTVVTDTGSIGIDGTLGSGVTWSLNVPN